MFQPSSPNTPHFKTSVSPSLWWGSRLAGLGFGVAAILALWLFEPAFEVVDPPIIQTVRLYQEDRPAPQPRIVLPNQTEIIPKTDPIIKPPATRTPSPASFPQLPVIDRLVPRVTSAPSTNISPQPSAKPLPPMPTIATAPSGQPNNSITTGAPANSEPARTGASPQSGQGQGQLRSSTRALLRARECARVDEKDRPADCPSNDELLRLLANERGPKYRPENADGFSRNEQAWRGIPPPCLDDGENAALKGTKLCLRFGNVPSRVRTPREICEARGLGGCADTPSQAAVNAAIEQVRQAEATKAKRP